MFMSEIFKIIMHTKIFKKYKRNKRLVLFFLNLLFFLLFYPSIASADYYFNPHYIISDEEATDHLSMSLSDIQGFLREKNSGLTNLVTSDYNGINKKASEIIWQAAVENMISPKLLIATLQKEQSLIETPFPTKKQLDRAMGYRCPDSGSCHPNTLDFGKQVAGAAWQFRQYFNNPNNWNYRVNETYLISGWFVTPMNQATAGLYNYTPHYSGNNHFWQIWQKYWGRDYPDGSLLKAYDSPAVWLIQYGARRLITSWGVLVSRFDPKKIISVSRSDLEKYETSLPIRFYNYSLLRLPNGNIYLLVNDELRYITSMEVFRAIGFNPEEITSTQENDLSGYKQGKDISVETVYPIGALLQNNQTGGVYYVEDGIRHPIYSSEIMNVNFQNRPLIKINQTEIDKYQIGEPIKFRDGEIIKADNDSKVYVISDGHRRWIKTTDAFAKFGYKWDNIVTTNQRAVDIHPLGEDIE